MKRALFVFSIYHYYREMLPVAEDFGRRGIGIDVLIGFEGSEAEDAAAHCFQAGFKVHRPPSALRYGEIQKSDKPASNGNANGNGKVPGILSRFANKLGAVGSLPHFLKIYSAAKRFGDELISQVAPSVVFGGPYHSCGGFDAGIALAAKSRRIRYCCLPVSAYVGERLAVQARFNNVNLGMLSAKIMADQSIAGKLLASVYPQWTRADVGRRLFMHEPVQMLAAKMTGLLDDNPWQKPSELYDLVFVESEFSKDLLLDSRYSPDKVVVSGKPLLDHVVENIGDQTYLAAMCADLSVLPSEPFLLVNIEPSAEHHYSTWDQHWKRFHEVMSCLSQFPIKKVLSLHPLCQLSNYLFVENQYGVKISQRYKIVELYPYCAAAVSFPCSTNLLSLEFGKKLIIYDFFGLTKDSWSTHEVYRLPGADIAYTSAELSALLQKTLSSTDLPNPESAHADKPSACDSIYEHAIS